MKAFKLSAAEIKPIAIGFGSCIASDLITVVGHPVGFLYRERPSDSTDSGWRFMSGTESEAFMEEPRNFALYDVNTIANYDPRIIPCLDSPVGTAFESSGRGAFVQVPFEAPDE